MYLSVIRSNVLDTWKLASRSGWVWYFLSVWKQELFEHKELEFDCTESDALLFKIEHFKCKTVVMEEERAGLWHMLLCLYRLYILLNQY